MRLVYTATMEPLQVGDIVIVGGQQLTVDYFAKPHKPDSEGKVVVKTAGAVSGFEYYVGVIGAQWIEREDRAPVCGSCGGDGWSRNLRGTCASCSGSGRLRNTDGSSLGVDDGERATQPHGA